MKLEIIIITLQLIFTLNYGLVIVVNDKNTTTTATCDSSEIVNGTCSMYVTCPQGVLGGSSAQDECTNNLEINCPDGYDCDITCEHHFGCFDTRINCPSGDNTCSVHAKGYYVLGESVITINDIMDVDILVEDDDDYAMYEAKIHAINVGTLSFTCHGESCFYESDMYIDNIGDFTFDCVGEYCFYEANFYGSHVENFDFNCKGEECLELTLIELWDMDNVNMECHGDRSECFYDAQLGVNNVDKFNLKCLDDYCLESTPITIINVNEVNILCDGDDNDSDNCMYETFLSVDCGMNGGQVIVTCNGDECAYDSKVKIDNCDAFYFTCDAGEDDECANTADFVITDTDLVDFTNYGNDGWYEAVIYLNGVKTFKSQCDGDDCMYDLQIHTDKDIESIHIVCNGEECMHYFALYADDADTLHLECAGEGCFEEAQLYATNVREVNVETIGDYAAWNSWFYVTNSDIANIKCIDEIQDDDYGCLEHASIYAQNTANLDVYCDGSLGFKDIDIFANQAGYVNLRVNGFLGLQHGSIYAKHADSLSIYLHGEDILDLSYIECPSTNQCLNGGYSCDIKLRNTPHESIHDENINKIKVSNIDDLIFETLEDIAMIDYDHVNEYVKVLNYQGQDIGDVQFMEMSDSSVCELPNDPCCNASEPCLHDNIGDNTCFAEELDVLGNRVCPAGTTKTTC